MPTIDYLTQQGKPREFKPATSLLIEMANTICAEYEAQGFVLTLRQLYYQFVARDIIPNKQTEYKRLGDILGDARMAGLLDWSYMEDRGRNLEEVSHWESPSSILYAVGSQYRIEKWRDQPYYPVVMVEKDALTGVFGPVCRRLDVPLFPCKGYMSLSALWQLGQRLKGYAENGQIPIILHFGDHDPSGIDMTRDIGKRLTTFIGQDLLEEVGAEGEVEDDDGNVGVGIEIRRLALNIEQVRQYDPPPNPAKITDSRAAGYIKRFGRESWELDALNPTILGQLVEDAVEDLRDDDKWEAAVASERADRARLQRLARDWEAFAEMMGRTDDDEEDEDEDGDE